MHDSVHARGEGLCDGGKAKVDVGNLGGVAGCRDLPRHASLGVGVRGGRVHSNGPCDEEEAMWWWAALRRRGGEVVDYGSGVAEWLVWCAVFGDAAIVRSMVDIWLAFGGCYLKRCFESSMAWQFHFIIFDLYQVIGVFNLDCVAFALPLGTIVSIGGDHATNGCLGDRMVEVRAKPRMVTPSGTVSFLETSTPSYLVCFSWVKTLHIHGPGMAVTF